MSLFGSRRSGLDALAFALCVVLWSAIGSASAADRPGAAAPTAKPSATSVDTGSGALYSDRGAATCLQCHNSSPVADILGTPHAVKGDARTPFGQHDCESCHGPSADHVAAFAKGTFVEPSIVFNGPHTSPLSVRNQACLGCHQDVARLNWEGSPHQQNNLACTSCHTAHIHKDPVLVKETQVEKCFTCHKQERAESFEYSHHPMREGKVVCSNCHDPHGSAGPHQLKEFTVNETCYNCHAEKRGPMLWEHQPVREDCTNCHTPHGSNEASLMKDRQNFMCASCHSGINNNSGGDFGGAHSLPGNLQGTATFQSALANNRLCLNCHSQIHGSNSPSGTYFFR